MVREGHIESSRADVSMGEAADYLIEHKAELSESPRSLAIAIPENINDFANGLQRIVNLPVEVLLSIDKQRKCIVLTTGDRETSIHPLIEKDHKLEEREAAGSSTMHNHGRMQTGVSPYAPTYEDWIVAAEAAHEYKVPFQYIISDTGIVKHGFTDSEQWVPESYAIEKLWLDIRRKSERGIPKYDPDNPSKELEELFLQDQLKLANHRHLDGFFELAEWDDKEGIAQVLEDFLRQPFDKTSLRE